MSIANLNPRKEPSTHTSKSGEPALDVFNARDRTVAWVVRDVHRLYTSVTQKVLASANITIAHWYYLRVLAEHGELNQLELSKRVGIASTTAVPALDNMEKRGLVKRTRDPNDRRKYYVNLTEDGQRLIDQLMPLMVQILVRSVAGTTHEDICVFWKVLEQIERNLFDASSGDLISDDLKPGSRAELLAP